MDEKTPRNSSGDWRGKATEATLRNRLRVRDGLEVHIPACELVLIEYKGWVLSRTRKDGISNSHTFKAVLFNSINHKIFRLARFSAAFDCYAKIALATSTYSPDGTAPRLIHPSNYGCWKFSNTALKSLQVRICLARAKLEASDVYRRRGVLQIG
jgi:hypothetical protein